MEPLKLYGCRHDILGHYLKAIGLLRVLDQCADEPHRDSSAEGWWDLELGCFCLNSPKYPTKEKLTDFFAQNYKPTPFFSPWNTGGGMDEKKQIIFEIEPAPWKEFWAKNRESLLAHIADQKTLPNFTEPPELGESGIKFTLTKPLSKLIPVDGVEITTEVSKGKKAKPTVQFSWSPAKRKEFFDSLSRHSSELEHAIKFTSAVTKKFVPGKASICFDLADEKAAAALPEMDGVTRKVITKTSGKKAVIAVLLEKLKDDPEFVKSVDIGRRFFPRFQVDNPDERRLLEEFRDIVPLFVAEAIDSVFTTRVSERTQDNPLFLNRGDAGNGEVFRSFWGYYLEVQIKASHMVEDGLFAESSVSALTNDGKGSPFFPDAIKTYNNGSGWVAESFPFNGLDYVLAVEGGFAMRGTAGRTLAANSKRFAAFPFVFDSGDEMVDDSNEVKGTARSLWFPLWNRPTTYAELASFIGDAQARLPAKEARFSAEFVRALHAQGVDAGFAGWQEFRFKMKISRVPWVTTGRYVEAVFRQEVTRLNRGLAPLDESRFMDQFEIVWKGSKADPRSPHQVRTEINAAMETAAQEPTPYNCLDLLMTVFRACHQIAASKAFRDKLPGGRGTFFATLPMMEWDGLLGDLDKAEFRIGRALASIIGLRRQMDGKYSETQPMLGSLLPLKLGRSGWFLPEKGDRSNQAVWSGSDLCSDLSLVLHRRYIDSLDDYRPALRSARGAPLRDILAFLRGDLDDHLIACWVEALSLIGWEIGGDEMLSDDDECAIESIPPAYAALRSLLELECEWQGSDRSKWTKRRSHQPFTQLCQRSITSLPVAVNDSLRWIGIWGITNPWGTKARAEKPRLSGRDIVRLEGVGLTFAQNQQRFATRLPAAVCIPLEWRDRWKLFRAISLPQTS